MISSPTFITSSTVRFPRTFISDVPSPPLVKYPTYNSHLFEVPETINILAENKSEVRKLSANLEAKKQIVEDIKDEVKAQSKQKKQEE